MLIEYTDCAFCVLFLDFYLFIFKWKTFSKERCLRTENWRRFDNKHSDGCVDVTWTVRAAKRYNFFLQIMCCRLSQILEHFAYMVVYQNNKNTKIAKFQLARIDDQNEGYSRCSICSYLPLSFDVVKWKFVIYCT